MEGPPQMWARRLIDGQGVGARPSLSGYTPSRTRCLTAPRRSTTAFGWPRAWTGLRCKGRLEPIGIEAVGGLVPPGVREWVTEAVQCGVCHQVYGQGTHYHRLEQMVVGILVRAASPSI
jgi:hypothetical protein